MEPLDDLELIEKYFRKELSPDEAKRFNERLTADPGFKNKFETESLVHKTLMFSREREIIKTLAVNPAPAQPVAQLLDNKSLILVGGTALFVWAISTFASGLTSLPQEYIKWVGLGIAIAGSIILLTMMNKTMNLRLVIVGLFNGLLVFVTASGIDAINQGAEGASGTNVTESHLVPFTGSRPWWPTQSLEDSLEVNRKQIEEMRIRINSLIASKLNALPQLNFGLGPWKFSTVVVPRSQSVVSNTTYEAEVFLASSPVGRKIEMYQDGKSIPLEADPSGVLKGKVSFSATADQFDKTGRARKKFLIGIHLGDSTYTKEVEYYIQKPK